MNFIPKRLFSLSLALIVTLSVIPGAAAYHNRTSWVSSRVTAMDQIPEQVRNADFKTPLSRLEMFRTAVLAENHYTGSQILLSGGELTPLDYFGLLSSYAGQSGRPAADAERFPSWDPAQSLLTFGQDVMSESCAELNGRFTAACQEGIAPFYGMYQVVDSATTPEPSYQPEPEPVPEVTEPEETEPEVTEPEETEPEVTEPEETEPEATEPEETEPEVTEPEETEPEVTEPEETEPEVTEPEETEPEVTEPEETEPEVTEPEETEPEETIQQANNPADFALQFLGYSYAYGGKSPEEGFDCSGFVYYVYKQFGYTLYPGATNQWNCLSDTIIPQEELCPGDLVFFSDNGEVSGMTHVGIYIGNGQMVHAANPSKGIVITPLSMDYYAEQYLGAKRVG